MVIELNMGAYTVSGVFLDLLFLTGILIVILPMLLKITWKKLSRRQHIFVIIPFFADLGTFIILFINFIIAMIGFSMIGY